MVQGTPEVRYLCCLCAGGPDPWVSPVKARGAALAVIALGGICLMGWALVAAAAKTEFEVKCGKLDGKSMCLIDEATLDALINSNQRAIEAAKRCATQRQA